jgi:hypothetical protein
LGDSAPGSPAHFTGDRFGRAMIFAAKLSVSFTLWIRLLKKTA